MKSSISESTLRSMESDAAKMKAELHVGVHLNALAAEVRRLSGGDTPGGVPTVEEVDAALKFLALFATNDGLSAESRAVRNKALAVLDRYFAPAAQ